jgi:hypothetical protein
MYLVVAGTALVGLVLFRSPFLRPVRGLLPPEARVALRPSVAGPARQE